MSSAKKGPDKPTVIKKYANRRLYDTGRSSYVTLDDLCVMVKENHDFVVYDAKTGEDLTRSVLTQIIVEQEGKSGQQNLLPISFLRQLIGFYGDSMQSLVPNYLAQTIEMFTKNQEQFRAQMTKTMGSMGSNPMGNMGMGNMGMGNMNPMAGMNMFGGGGNMPSFEELTRKNMEMFETAMKAWTPIAMNNAAEIKKRIDELQKELNKLGG